jgi:hypothetical protein
MSDLVRVGFERFPGCGLGLGEIARSELRET